MTAGDYLKRSRRSRKGSGESWTRRGSGEPWIRRGSDESWTR